MAPKNLGISRQLALLVVAVGVLLCIFGIGVTVLTLGLDDKSTPIITTVFGILGTALVTAMTGLKATEAADTAAKAHTLAEYTASQSAAIQQAIVAHCGEICPSLNCPLRGKHHV